MLVVHDWTVTIHERELPLLLSPVGDLLCAPSLIDGAAVEVGVT